jgi:hypothetical protein
VKSKVIAPIQLWDITGSIGQAAAPSRYSLP